MIDIRGLEGLAWDANLCPVGESSLQKEPFHIWWNRNKEELSNLHPQIAEQWVYRHWAYSPFCHLPILAMSWRVEKWTTDQILKTVHWGDPTADRHADHDYRLFHGKDREPAKSMDSTGTWNIPPVIIESSSGFLTFNGPQPSWRYWLIEGHLRRRYLNALFSRNEGAGKPQAEHEIFVLSLPENN